VSYSELPDTGMEAKHDRLAILAKLVHEAFG
jgi:hypothetical protein